MNKYEPFPNINPDQAYNNVQDSLDALVEERLKPQRWKVIAASIILTLIALIVVVGFIVGIVAIATTAPSAVLWVILAVLALFGIMGAGVWAAIILEEWNGK